MLAIKLTKESCPKTRCDGTNGVHRILLNLVLTIHAGLLGYGAYVHSPTLNEPAHLAAGLFSLKLWRFDLYMVDPPLPKIIAALPVLAAGAQTDWHEFSFDPAARIEFSIGEDFVTVNHEQTHWLFTIGRWACIPFSLLGAYICFRWAKELYGPLAGFLALFLWCFSPNIIAHGQLITPDIPATALGITAAYIFWHWLRNPTWLRIWTSGLVLGLAELTKGTLIILFPLWLFIWLVYHWPDRGNFERRAWFRQLGMLGCNFAIAIYLLNLGYGFEGTGTRLGDFQFVSSLLSGHAIDKTLPFTPGNRFAGSWIGDLPVPLPKSYVQGIDQQKHDFELHATPSYLNSEFHETGFWYYYLYALTIKVPIGTWILVALAATKWFWTKWAGCPETEIGQTVTAASLISYNRRRDWRDEFVLLCPAVALLTFVSSQVGFSAHMRYVLPMFPLVFVWIGRIGPFLGRKHWVITAIASASLAWSVISSLSVYPHNLSYFNELVGGATGGPKHLIHSNVDWGQDLLFLKKWIDQHPEAQPLKLAYFGSFDPKYVGIDYSAPQDIPTTDIVESGQSKIPPGWYAISVNFVRGLPFSIYKGDGSKISLRQNALVAFQRLNPVMMAGYSIYIYHVTE